MKDAAKATQTQQRPLQPAFGAAIRECEAESGASYREQSEHLTSAQKSYTRVVLIYLDLCCFNRPWDDQLPSRVRLETEAKLQLQERVRAGKNGLVWSYALSAENQFNPFRERRESIATWQSLATTNVSQTQSITEFAETLVGLGATAFDALHFACAREGGAAIFVTTDDRLRRLLQRTQSEKAIRAMLPQDALAVLENWYEN